MENQLEDSVSIIPDIEAETTLIVCEKQDSCKFFSTLGENLKKGLPWNKEDKSYVINYCSKEKGYKNCGLDNN